MSTTTNLWALCLALCFGLFSPLEAEHAIYSPRNYDTEVSLADAADIRYLVSAMGNANNPFSYVALFAKRNELKQSGDRIENVHPLRFLACAFSDEQMKVSMRNIQKNLTWKNFLYGENGDSGLANTFEQEADRGNLRTEQIYDFTSTLGVDFGKYNQLIQDRKWEAVVAALISDVPRKGHYRRNDY